MNTFKKYYGKIKRFFPRQWRRILFMWQFIHSEKHPYVKLTEYAEACPDKVEIQKRTVQTMSYKVPVYWGEMDTSLLDGGCYTTIVTRIRDGICFVYSDIVLLSNGQVFYELKEQESIRAYTNFVDEALLYDTDTWCKIRPHHEVKHLPAAIKIGGMFGFNYYHFMYQILPKFSDINGIDASVPILLDIAAKDVSSMDRLVKIVNKQHREIIYMSYGVWYEVDNLYYVSSSNFVVPNYKRHTILPENSACFSKKSIDWLRSELLPHRADISTPKRIFIARRKASSKRSYNEAECFAAIKDFGFKEVYPEQLSIEEQMTLFNNAELIVGATGAALSNIVFANASCKVIVLSNYKFRLPIFSSIADLVGVKMLYLHDKKLGISKDGVKLHRNFNIDVKQLNEIVTQLLLP